MILVDTSVWVASRSGKEQQLTKTLMGLLTSHQALGHDLVYLELLLGEGGDARKQLLSRYTNMPYAPSVDLDAVVQFVKKHELAAKGVGAVDACLLYAAYNQVGEKAPRRIWLWTLDTNLHTVARVMGCAYEG